MSRRHPIISVTGSSGAGTTTVKHAFDQIFRREGIDAASIEGDAFHRYDRAGMKRAMADAEATGNGHFSHFGVEANPLAMVVEQAGGLATDGENRILDLQPTSLHQRIPLVFGSSTKVERVRAFHDGTLPLGERSPLFGRRGLFRR